MVKRSRDQSAEAPSRLKLVEDHAAGLGLHSQTLSMKASRPRSRLWICRSISRRSTTICVRCRMVHARLPQHVLAAHALEPHQHVLKRVVERVPHVKGPRDVRAAE